MGKSHIGLTYSQEINEILDKLANMVTLSSPGNSAASTSIPQFSFFRVTCVFRMAVSCLSGPAGAVTSRSKLLLCTPARIPQATSSSWRYSGSPPCPVEGFSFLKFLSAKFTVSGLRRLHSPAQQHRHGLRALVVREAHQHDLLPQDQGAVSVEAQRPGDAAQQVLYQKGQEARPRVAADNMSCKLSLLSCAPVS